MLKPMLARGELRAVGATTLDEYRTYIEKDAALERRFQPVMVGEPTDEDTIGILRGLKERYEVHHGVRIQDNALIAAATLSNRYIADRFLPDKAIDLVDEAASKIRIEIDSLPTEIDEVDRRVMQLEIELTSLRKEKDDASKERRAAIESELAELKARSQEMKAQWQKEKEAIKAVATALRRSRAGLQDPNRPIGSFLFLGPTGVGKTELARALAEFMFDSEHAMVRIDMSEYMEKHSVSRLVGAPPGYVGYEEGGQLTEAVRRRPYSVVLLDEIEKAHPDVFNTLLQVMDDGRLTDGQGRTVDFKNVVLIMTSNIPGGRVGVEANFKPEFINRLDDIVEFQPLTREQLTQIVDIQVERLIHRVREREIDVELNDAARTLLGNLGYDPTYGARPLKRVIQKRLVDPLALAILDGRFVPGDTVRVDAADGQLVLERAQAAAAAA